MEALEQPYDLAFTIMHMRSYAAAKAMIDHAKQQSDVVPGPAVNEVREIMELLFRERNAAQRRV